MKKLGFLLLLRKQWLAVAAYCALLAVLVAMRFASLAGDETRAMAIGFGLILGVSFAAIVATLLLRFGLLAAIAAFLCVNLLSSYPVTADVSSPHFTAFTYPVPPKTELGEIGQGAQRRKVANPVRPEVEMSQILQTLYPREIVNASTAGFQACDLLQLRRRHFLARRLAQSVPYRRR